MKYAEALSERIIEDWREYYIDYKVSAAPRDVDFNPWSTYFDSAPLAPLWRPRAEAVVHRGPIVSPFHRGLC